MKHARHVRIIISIIQRCAKHETASVVDLRDCCWHSTNPQNIDQPPKRPKGFNDANAYGDHAPTIETDEEPTSL